MIDDSTWLKQCWPDAPRHCKINLDLDLQKFFVRADSQDTIVLKPRVEHHDLNREIYFRPSASPLISVADDREGSCFQDLYIPTASVCWYTDHHGAWRPEPIPCELSLDAYIDQIDAVIHDSIVRIYQNHADPVLAFSGGIDSMVLLAYIIDHDVLSRTTLHVFDNVTQHHASCLHIDAHTRQSVTDLLDSLKSQIAACAWSQCDVTDIARIFNTGGLADIKCYTSRILLDHYQNRAVIFGWHGNQALLHKDIFLDQIRLCNAAWRSGLTDHIAGQSDFYTRGLRDYDASESPIDLAHRHLVIKPWSCLDRVHDNRVYAPLGDGANLLWTRMLDFARIHPDVILDAQIGRELIRRRCAWLGQYISHETVRENDNLAGFSLPSHLIDVNTLRLPPNLRHHSDGTDYLQHEIAIMEDQGHLAINSAVAIRSLQYISQEFA